MQKLNSLAAIAVLLISTINSPVLFSSIALSQEQTTTTTPTTTEPAKTEPVATQPATTEPPKTETPTTTQPTTEPVSPPPETPKEPITIIEPVEPPRQPVCPSPPPPIACGENQGLSTSYDDKGCVTGYNCKEIPKEEVGQVNVCPEVPAPTISCKANEQMNKITDEKGCVTGYNCISTAPPTEARPEPICLTVVPEKPSCDGNLVPIFDKGCLTGYNCIPSGCRQETDSSGFNRVVCMERPKCPAGEEQEKLKRDCFQQGGNPVPFQDPSGCTFYDCRFTREESTPNPITGHESCPSEESVNSAMQQCKSSGLAPRTAFEGGCKVTKCVQMRTDVCERIIEPARIAFEEKCKAKGLPAVIKMDENGCQVIECGANQQDICQTDIPPEAFKKCQEKGGEMIVKKDDRGCVAFANCVGRGDERDSYVEAVEEVPDATVLLSLALKLEQLKVELIKLSKESGEIAKFYAAEDSLDEERYNRVSSMFDAAADRIDEIKIKIRDNVDTMTTDDIVEVKHDIKYIKEVTLKDILYVMLSNSDDVRETLESSKKISTKEISVEEIEQNAKSCGTDGFCFDKAIRACKPVTFQPEGRNGPLVSIAGLRDKNCVLHITMQSSDQIPPGYTKDSFYMDCPIADYAVGVRGPEDILPTCEGPMAKFAKQFGGGEVTGGASFPPPEGGPGGCETTKDCSVYCIDNYDECKQWIKEHPAYGPLPSKEELRKVASGKQETIRTGPSQEVKFAGPGGCTSPQECDKFCRSKPTVCINWCDENPGMCPEEELGKVPEAKASNEFKDEKNFLQNVRKIGPVTTIDFETLPDGTPLYNGMKLSGKEYSSLGVTFYTPSEDYLKAFGPYEPFKPIGTLSLSPGFGPFESGSATDDDLEITFTTPVNAVGFYMLDLDKPNSRESVTFFDEGGKIIKTMPLNNFVGFISPSVGISKVRILENANDADDVAYDNLYFVKMGEVSGRCDCTWAAGSREHPRGCPVLCSDYSYDETACDAQNINGCVWLPGGGPVPQPIEQPIAQAVQACVGCLNNGVCDIGECSECIDCLKGTRSITGEIVRMEWSSEG